MTQDPTQPAPQEPDAQTPRVLVVDDFVDGGDAFADYLSLLGYEVDVARDGVEAVKKARDGRPDVILMDLSLPLLDGWEATRILKADEATKDISVVALSGHVSDKHRELSARAGCDEFLSKPAGVDEVETKIRDLLRRSKKK